MLNRRELFGAGLAFYFKTSSDPHDNDQPSGSETSFRLEVAGGILAVKIRQGKLNVSTDSITRWLIKAARAVTAYYGQFPVPLIRVIIRPRPDAQGVSHGTTWGGTPPLIRISVGQDATPAQLHEDWVLTHEMVHLAFPSVPDEHHWIEEGIATYVEPIARTLIADLTPADVWREMLASMNWGEPNPANEGLDQIHTWASTYWGGALFCLLADIQILQATANRKGLRDALRGVLHAGGSISNDWNLTKVLTVADRAIGVPALQHLYAEMGPKPHSVDLPRLWKQLGVANVNGTMVFDDRAPLAGARKAIFSPSANVMSDSQ
jgi:hypothetical protein